MASSLVDGCDTVFHLAGPASVATSFDAPAEFVRAHVAGTATVLEASRRAGVSRVVHVSSAEVYGAPERNPVDESHRLQARSPYAAAKIGAEHLVESYRLAHEMRITMLRPFSVYGPRQSRGGVIADIVRQLLAGEVVGLVAPSVVRDFCFVDDLVEAMVSAASPAGLPGTFNVGTGAGVSIAALARAAAEAVGRDVIVRARDADRPRRAEIQELVADATRIRAALGWRPRTSLVEGLRRTIHWFRHPEAA